MWHLGRGSLSYSLPVCFAAFPHISSLIEPCKLHACRLFYFQTSESEAKPQPAHEAFTFWCLLIAKARWAAYWSPPISSLSHKLNFRSCLVENQTIREQQSAVKVITIEINVIFRPLTARAGLGTGAGFDLLPSKKLMLTVDFVFFFVCRHIENWTGLQTLKNVDMELYTGLQKLWVFRRRNISLSFQIWG